MRVRDLQQYLGKFTNDMKGTNLSDCHIYIETQSGQRNFGVMFFFLKLFFSSWHSGTEAFFGLLVLVLLNNRCATGAFFGGTAWHICW